MEALFSTHACLKQNTKTEKRSSDISEVVLQLSKPVFLLDSTLRCKQ
jgi:hypothetical protein